METKNGDREHSSTEEFLSILFANNIANRFTQSTYIFFLYKVLKLHSSFSTAFCIYYYVRLCHISFNVYVFRVYCACAIF